MKHLAYATLLFVFVALLGWTLTELSPIPLLLASAVFAGIPAKIVAAFERKRDNKQYYKQLPDGHHSIRVGKYRAVVDENNEFVKAGHRKDVWKK